MADELTMLDVGEIEGQLKLLTSAITAGKADDISTFFRDLLIRIKVSERTLNEYKRYIPIIYNQVSLDNISEDGHFRIEIGPYANANQTLLMMIPNEASVVEDNQLHLLKNNSITKTYDIYKESNSGELVPITNGDIVPNRTVLFRLLSLQNVAPKAIIINTSGLYNETISNLYVTGEAVFASKPMIINSYVSGGDPDRLVSNVDLKLVDDKINTLNSKFVITTEDAQDVAEREETPVGAIVFQVE